MVTRTESVRRGFTLLEVLVAISIIMLMSALTLSGLRSARNHRVVEQAAARLQMLLELGRGVALSEGESIYLVVAGHDALPEGAPLRAYTLVRDLNAPQLVHDWQLLPEGVRFAPDGDGVGIDLLEQEPIHTFDDLATGTEEGVVSGEGWALLELTPQGTVASGNPTELRPAHLLLDRGEWIQLALTNFVFVSDTWVEGTLDRVRIVVRPQTGILKLERVTL